MARRKKNDPPPPTGDGGQAQVVYVEKKGGFLKPLLIVVGVLFLLMVGCVALLGSAADQVIEDIESEEQLVLGAVELTSCGIEPVLGLGEATLTYTSPFDETKGWVGVDVSFTDQDGVVVGSGTAAFQNVPAGGEARDDITWPLSDGTTSVRCSVVEATVLD